MLLAPLFTFYLTCMHKCTNIISLHSLFYNKNTKSVNREKDLISREIAEQVRALYWIITGQRITGAR